MLTDTRIIINVGKIMDVENNKLALTRLMYLVSPTLPTGAYAYSQGLEYAIDSELLKSHNDIISWIRGNMLYGLGTLDIPILIRAYRAWRRFDIDALNHWNQFVRASRETAELLLEDEQLGEALLRLLQSLKVGKHADVLSSSIYSPPSYVILFAYAGSVWQIELDDILQGYVWSWLENQIAAATKLVPLGQSDAQKMMLELMQEIPEVCERSFQLDDQDIGMSLPNLAIQSACHERQYSRLFRS